MSVVALALPRVVGVGLAIVGAAITIVAIRAASRPSPVRERRDLLRLVLSISGIVAVALIVRVGIAPLWLLGAVAAGGALGWVTGSNLDLRWSDDRLVGVRQPLGIAAYLVGLVGMQLAANLSRTGLLRVGIGLSAFGAALLAGTIAGRRPRLRELRTAGRPAAVASSVIAAIVALSGLAVPEAAGQTEPRWVVSDIQIGSSSDEPPSFLDVAVSSGAIRVTVTDPPTTVFELVFDIPPEELVPGRDYVLETSASGRISTDEGTGVRQGALIYLIDGRWRGRGPDGGVAVDQSCTEPVGGGQVTCTDPATNEGAFEFTAPGSGDEFSVAFGVLNCGEACAIEWTYRLEEVATEPPPTTTPGTIAPTATSASPPTAAVTSTVPPTPTTTPPTTVTNDDTPITGDALDPSPPPDDEVGDGEIDATEAVTASIVALVVQALIGLTTWSDAAAGIRGLVGDRSGDVLEVFGRDPSGGLLPPLDEPGTVGGDGRSLPPLDEPGTILDPSGPAPILDEHGNPMTVNDGTWPDVPVGYVWWHDGQTGRWVPPDEARDLVEAAEAAAAERVADSEQAIADHMRRSGRDWDDLRTKTRLDAAAAQAAAEASREVTAIRIIHATTIRDAAAAAGYEDILDYLDRNPVPDLDEIRELYAALERRGADQAAIDALGDVDIVGETISGTRDDVAALLDRAGMPHLAAALRNPGVTMQIGAAIATGGQSELVAIPLEIIRQVHEAQQQHLAETGRMMTSAELIGSFGKAAATEAVYEVGGQAAEGVMRGAGRLVRSADDAAGAGARAVGGTAGVRTDALDEAGEIVAARSRGGTAADLPAGRRTGAAGEAVIDLPPRPNARLAELPPGTRIPDELIAETGFSDRMMRDMQHYADVNGVTLQVRSTNPYSAAHLDAGTAIPKPLEVKPKTINDLDVLLGANPDHRGTVGLFPPKMPDTEGMSQKLIDALEDRARTRAAEIRDHLPDIEANPRLRVDGGRVFDAETGKAFAGDMDLVAIRDARTGELVTGDRYTIMVSEMRSLGIAEHGGERYVVSDLTRRQLPGTDDYVRAETKARELAEDLAEGHRNGEIVVEFSAGQPMARGPELHELDQAEAGSHFARWTPERLAAHREAEEALWGPGA